MSERFRQWLRSIPAPDRALRELEPQDLPAEPSTLYVRWMQDAVEGGEVMPQALNLATRRPEGGVDARTVVLRDIDGATWCFATSTSSPKADQLGTHPQAALTALWARFGRQVRIRGIVSDLGDAAGTADFRARSQASRAAALVGRQSQRLDSREEYREAVEDARTRLEREPETVPPTWRLFGLSAQVVEFWQETPGGEQVRVQYRRTGNDWAKELLWP